MTILALATIATLMAPNAWTQELHVFGGEPHDDYLGCVKCPPSDSRSIWNRNGKSGFNSFGDSIWNTFSPYGRLFSDKSPYNRFAPNPAVIVDRTGEFFGYFTANEFAPDATRIELLLRIANNQSEARHRHRELGELF